MTCFFSIVWNMIVFQWLWLGFITGWKDSVRGWGERNAWFCDHLQLFPINIANHCSEHITLFNLWFFVTLLWYFENILFGVPKKADFSQSMLCETPHSTLWILFFLENVCRRTLCSISPAGSDMIYPRLLKEAREKPVGDLTEIFLFSLATGEAQSTVE